MNSIALIEQHKGRVPVHRLCALLGMSRSGYYAARHRAPSRRAQMDERLAVDIRATHRRYGRRYGSPRVTEELRALGHRVGRHRVARLMKQRGLAARPRRRFVVTTVKDESATPAPNLLDRKFHADAPNKAWVGDITYVPTLEGWLFLAVLLDLHSRRVVGWATSTSLKKDVALQALRRALGARQPAAGLIHHTDRGCQYTSKAYRALLADYGAIASMSRAGNCFDNAVAESFFGTLKAELERRTFASRAEAHQAIAHYIDGFYNPIRRHSTLGQLSPIDFERLAFKDQAA